MQAYGLSYSWGLVQVRDRARCSKGVGGFKSVRALYLIDQSINVINNLICDMIDR